MKQIISMKKNHEFRRVYGKGISAATGTLVLYCRKNRLDVNRLGLTVGTKVGCAVVRNRVRRRLREIYRLQRETLQTGYDLVIVARGRAAGASYQALLRDFKQLTKKLRLLREKTS